MSIPDIVLEVIEQGSNNVTITGGEPLEQAESVKVLVRELLNRGYTVSIETSGEAPFDTREFTNGRFSDTRLSFVVDIKLNESTALAKYVSKYEAMNLTSVDFLKIVIGSTQDMFKAANIKAELQARGNKATFAFSAMEGAIAPKDLLKLMLKFGQHDAILNVQLHKMLDLKEDKDA